MVQQNAANAEESASASEEMNAQAGQMKQMVNELVILVGGTSNGEKHTEAKTSLSPNISGKKRLPVSEINTNHNKMALPNTRELNSDQVIPMDDADFKDF